MLILVGCQEDPADEGPLPTLIDVDSLRTDTPEPSSTPLAETTDDEPSQAELNRPTLPPTFTPSPTPTTSPTPTPEPTADLSQFEGTLYYILNGSQIIAQDSADNVQIRFDFGTGGVEDLTFSPDRSLMAFVAPGNGSAREVFIASPDGSYIQQVSCLGQARVQHPVWSPDGESLVWLSGQTIDTPLDIYIANWEGSNNCPDGNNQRQLLDADIINFGDMTFSSDGEYVYFSDNDIYAVSVADGDQTDQLTFTLGFGPDYNLTFAPGDELVFAYLQVGRGANTTNGVRTGNLFVHDADDPENDFPQIYQRVTLLTSFIWLDEQHILAASLDEIFVTEATGFRPNMLATEITLVGDPVLASDGENVLFRESLPDLPGTTQAYIVDIEGLQVPVPALQITGEINNLFWLTDSN